MIHYRVSVPPKTENNMNTAVTGEKNKEITDKSYPASVYSESSAVSSAQNTPELIPSSTSSTPKFPPRRSSSADSIPLLDLLSPSNVSVELNRHKTYKWMKNYGRKLNDKRKKKFHISKEDRIKWVKVLNDKFERAYVRIDKTTKASQTEKISFAAVTYIIFLSGLVIGKHPEQFHILYTVLFAVLMPIRFITYYKIGYGFYLADLCYYVNVLLLIYIWILPSSKMLFISCASFSWGTLSFAVITWRNKLVPHSIDKSTSTFIHVLPGVVMYVITHQLPHEFKQKRFPGSVKLEHWELMHGILYTSFLYFVWQLSYHYFITIKRADQIKNGQVTSFEYLRKAFANKPIGKLVNSLPEPFPVVAFTLIQYGYQLGTMSLCPIFFQHKYAASAFVSFIFLTSCYNGATYYVDFYGKKFQKEVLRLQDELNKTESRLAEAQRSTDDLLAKQNFDGSSVSANATPKLGTTDSSVSIISN
ncbi:hypothetical protein HII13_002799 [Brettanomyces bruxellensis]|nr:hypothetical protein HII13_002799 [Brettanomyces bruxellensis]